MSISRKAVKDNLIIGLFRWNYEQSHCSTSLDMDFTMKFYVFDLPAQHTGYDFCRGEL